MTRVGARGGRDGSPRARLPAELARRAGEARAARRGGGEGRRGFAGGGHRPQLRAEGGDALLQPAERGVLRSLGRRERHLRPQAIWEI